MAMLNNQMVYIYIYITFLNKMPGNLKLFIYWTRPWQPWFPVNSPPNQTISAAN